METWHTALAKALCAPAAKDAGPPDEKRDQGGKWSAGGGQSLPPRTPDTMSEAIALSSPSGRMSGRAKEQGMKRLGEALFGPGGLQRAPVPQPSKKESLLRRAKELRDLAARGMRPRAFVKEAAELERQAALLSEAPAKDTDPVANELRAQRIDNERNTDLDRSSHERGPDLAFWLTEVQRAKAADTTVTQPSTAPAPHALPVPRRLVAGRA